MAEIRFREVQELLQEDVGEVQGLCDEKRITDILAVPSALLEDACEIINGLYECVDDATSLAFSYQDGVLYSRIFDGERYLFPLPFLLTDEADSEGACLNLAAYTVREMIPLIITDVPRDELGFLQSIFPHMDASVYEEDDDCFFVKVNNECDMLDGIPELEYNGITLDALREDDKERYAALCRDRDLNRYWGYDVDADNPDGNADFYLAVAEREFADGVAIALAVRENGEFVGEATVYGFDYRGTASIAVRIMKDCHSRGLGSRATEALILLAKEMGLTKLRAEILNENEASIKMTSKFMKLEKTSKSKTYFTLSL